MLIHHVCESLNMQMDQRRTRSNDKHSHFSTKNKIKYQCCRCPTFQLAPGSSICRILGDPDLPYPGCCEHPGPCTTNISKLFFYFTQKFIPKIKMIFSNASIMFKC